VNTAKGPPGWGRKEGAKEEARGTCHHKLFGRAGEEGLREGPQTYRGHDLDLSRLDDVIDHVSIQFAMCNFLLIHWN